MPEQNSANAIAQMEWEYRKRSRERIRMFIAGVLAISVLFGLPVVLVLAGRPDLFGPIFAGLCCALGGFGLGCMYAARRKRRAVHAQCSTAR